MKTNSLFIGTFDQFSQQFPEKVASSFVHSTNHIAEFVDKHFKESLVIVVPVGIQVAEPICLQTNNTTESVVIKKVVVIVECGASVKICVCNSAEIKNTIEYAYYQFILHKNSQLLATVAYRECRYKKLFFDFELHEHANAQLKGAYLLKHNQTIDIISQQKHIGEQSTSSVRLHGALYDAAHAKYQGTIAITESGHKTNAEQYNKTIILSDKAHAIAIPNLEVKTNDVQCRHGSAVGRFDALQLFYMQSRGLETKRAENLLLQGFLGIVNNKFF